MVTSAKPSPAVDGKPAIPVVNRMDLPTLQQALNHTAARLNKLDAAVNRAYQRFGSAADTQAIEALQNQVGNMQRQIGVLTTLVNSVSGSSTGDFDEHPGDGLAAALVVELGKAVEGFAMQPVGADLAGRLEDLAKQVLDLQTTPSGDAETRAVVQELADRVKALEQGVMV